MKATLVSETYTIEDRDETGLIPEGTIAVIVDYNKGGETALFYNAESREGEALNDHSARIDELNSRRPTTQEGIERVVDSLKNASK